MVLAEDAQVQRRGCAVGGDHAAGSVRGHLDVVRADVGPGTATEPAHCGAIFRGDRRHRGDAGVVDVEYGDAAAAQRAHELGLRLERGLDAAESAGVGHADHEHDTDVRLHQSGEPGDLARRARAELAHQEPRAAAVRAASSAERRPRC